MIEHDVQPGRLERCQICGCEDLRLVIDLGHQPLCDSLLIESQLNQPEVTYPLRLNRCPECGLTQLDYIVDGSTVYHPEYPYRSGITRELAEYQRALAGQLIEKLGVEKDALCIDIGSNDGTLLSGFQDRKMRALGVEPTNIAEVARQENNIDTLQSFFTEDLARDIVKDHGNPAVVTATNVFAHMAPLGEVMRGIDVLLSDDGVFVTESHYLLDVIERSQYDTIYHEHVRTYSLKSLTVLFGFYGLEVFDVQRASRYGGNIRAYVGRKGRRPVESSVSDLIKLEEESGLFQEQAYETFRAGVERSRDDLLKIAFDAKCGGLSLVGNSCPGRCSTLLNYCGMRRDLMPYLAEQPTSLKLGKFLPGLHLPIVNNQILIDEQPDIVVLLAWHYAEPIGRQLRERGLKSKLVAPLPNVVELDV